MIKNYRFRIIITVLLSCCSLQLLAAAPKQGMPYGIASAHPLATRAGERILREGGNAFDAAIAITSTLAVVEPTGSGLGGGGFFLLHRSKDSKQVMLDAREKASTIAALPRSRNMS